MTTIKNNLLKISKTLYQALLNKYKSLKNDKREMSRQELPNIPIKKGRNEIIKVDISLTSIVKATLLIILLYALTQFVIEINQILILFFVALLFSAAINPWIDKLESKKIPRFLGVLFMYATFLFVMWLVVISIVPLVAGQISELASRAQNIFGNLVEGKDDGLAFFNAIKRELKKVLTDIDTQALIDNAASTLNQLSNSLGGIAGNLWGLIKILFNSLFNLIMVLFLTYFMVVDSKAIEEFIKALFPSRHGNYIAAKSTAIKEKIGYWLRGQVLLMVGVGIITFILLSIIGLQYAATLALFAALMEAIPVAGPILSFLLALPIAANDSSIMILITGIVFFLIHELESNVLVPMVMKKTVGLNPIIVIFAMLVGYHFLGILGIILSIPVAASIYIFLKDYLEKEK